MNSKFDFYYKICTTCYTLCQVDNCTEPNIGVLPCEICRFSAIGDIHGLTEYWNNKDYYDPFSSPSNAIDLDLDEIYRSNKKRCFPRIRDIASSKILLQDGGLLPYVYNNKDNIAATDGKDSLMQTAFSANVEVKNFPADSHNAKEIATYNTVVDDVDMERYSGFKCWSGPEYEVMECLSGIGHPFSITIDSRCFQLIFKIGFPSSVNKKILEYFFHFDFSHINLAFFNEGNYNYFIKYILDAQSKRMNKSIENENNNNVNNDNMNLENDIFPISDAQELPFDYFYKPTGAQLIEILQNDKTKLFDAFSEKYDECDKLKSELEELKKEKQQYSAKTFLDLNNTILDLKREVRTWKSETISLRKEKQKWESYENGSDYYDRTDDEEQEQEETRYIQKKKQKITVIDLT